MSESLDRTLEAMLEVTERLTALLAHQATAFEAHRPQDAAAEMPEVSRLAGVYRAGSEGLRAQPALLKGVDPALRQRLVRATETFEAVLDRQGRALTASKTVTEGVVKAIADEIAARRNIGQAYGPGAARKPSATAITLNQRA
ncbi:MAG TPA: flagellar basal body protein [Caulobacteraceae bacterium]|nr:flagellar basal body protein [Caulobacteraceae bacterium]